MAKTTLDNLATSIQNEFSLLHDQINGLEQKVNGLESGQQDIFLRLDQLAPHFEVKDLDKRVTKLELKANN